MALDDEQQQELDAIQSFYDGQYYAAPGDDAGQIRRHDRQLAARLGIGAGQRVLDVACGTGGWLNCCAARGARVAGVDLSTRAIAVCRAQQPHGQFEVSAAETLPFDADHFDWVTCLGSLEHFVDPIAALNEMRRVAHRDARFVILVPNAGFLTRRLGLFGGTFQTQAKEHVRSLAAWRTLFAAAGLEVESRWKDLHVLSRHWVVRRPWWLVPLRFAQAVSLALWPLRWQYQVYFLCRARPRPATQT